jgi:hypothetical protein
MARPDELDEYLRGGSALSRQYRREAAQGPPRALDRRVRRLAGAAQGKSPCLAPLAFAASVLLSMALVLALTFGPQSVRRSEDAPRLVRVAARGDATLNSTLGRRQQLYSSDPAHSRTPSAWLADIAALRRAGRGGEADAEYSRFKKAFPNYGPDETAARR